MGTCIGSLALSPGGDRLLVGKAMTRYSFATGIAASGGCWGKSLVRMTVVGRSGSPMAVDSSAGLIALAGCRRSTWAPTAASVRYSRYRRRRQVELAVRQPRGPLPRRAVGSPGQSGAARRGHRSRRLGRRRTAHCLRRPTRRRLERHPLPQEFRAKFGWQNDPKKARLLQLDE